MSLVFWPSPGAPDSSVWRSGRPGGKATVPALHVLMIHGFRGRILRYRMLAPGRMVDGRWSSSGIVVRRYIHPFSGPDRHRITGLFEDLRELPVKVLTMRRLSDARINVLTTGNRPESREEAAEAPGDLRNPKAVEPLIAPLNDPRHDVRRKVGRSLESLRRVSRVRRLSGHRSPSNGQSPSTAGTSHRRDGASRRNQVRKRGRIGILYG